MPSTAGWATFEARVRGRRFARCIERANGSIETGALDAAREALEEAKSLSPDAPEIAELESRIAARPEPIVIRPADTPRPESEPGWLQVVGAMAALLVLFSLFGFGLTQLYFTRPAQELLTAARTPATEDVTTNVKDRSLQEAATSGTATDPAEPIATTMTTATSTTSSAAASPPGAASVTAAPTSTGSATPAGRTEPKGVVAVGREKPGQRERAEPPRTAVAGRYTPPAPRPLMMPSSPPASSPSPSTSTSTSPPPAAPPASATPPAPTPVPDPPADAVAPAVAMRSPETVAAERTGSGPRLDTPVPASRVAGAAETRAEESARIRSVLMRYETAYNRLDASAASSVWPGVDRAALDRAFKGLLSQRVSLGLCDITVIGDIGGASCAGKARWEPRVGGGLQTADRHWTFNLRRTSDGWRIEQIRVR
jgi:hypothetical protein